MSKILALPLIVALFAACLVAPAPAPAAQGYSLPIKQARQQIRVATEMWAGLLDGRAHIGRCERKSSRAVRCSVVIKSPRTRCVMRVSVRRGADADTLRARGVRCRDA